MRSRRVLNGLVIWVVLVGSLSITILAQGPRGLVATSLPLGEAVETPAAPAAGTDGLMLSEGFEAWSPPGWTIVDNGGDCVWGRNDQFGRPNYAGGELFCADADSQACGPGSSMDTELRTPSLNLSGVLTASLEFSATYAVATGGDWAGVYLSSNGGLDWTELLSWTTSFGPETINLDLSPHVGSPDTHISFRYVASDQQGWFQVDHVRLQASAVRDVSGSYKSAPEAVFRGNPVSYTIVISNAGNSLLRDVWLSDPIPADAVYVPESVACSGGSCWYDPVDEAVYWHGQLGGGVISPRYFATRYRDGNEVFEIDLIKTNGWWVTGTWGTLGSCTVPGMSENMGIDYDEEHDLLYHSDRYTSTIFVTDLDCNLVDTFSCSGARGFSSGVTYLERSSPPEVWVTEWLSETSTRCDTSGTVLESFDVTWGHSPFGLVYNPKADVVRYAHEDGPDTLFDVDYAQPHPVLNQCYPWGSGWPTDTLGNRNGAAYDYSLGTYLLSDYMGNEYTYTDNIIEVNAACEVLNAWETYGPDNDSYDGSSIHRILDLAVVPPPPTVVSLTFAVQSPLCGRALTNTAVLTHPSLAQPLTLTAATDQVCWDKWVGGERWTPSLTSTFELSDTFAVVDVVTTSKSFVLDEGWDDDHLALLDTSVETGGVISGDDWLEWDVSTPDWTVVTLTKWFRLEPCTWTESLVSETVTFDSIPEPILQPARLRKRAPDLFVNSVYNPDIYPGRLTSYTLQYGNDGGLENDVWIEAEFPPSALYEGAQPPADSQAPDGTWARWQLGDMAQGTTGDITVTVALSDIIGSVVVVTNSIRDHLGQPLSVTRVQYALVCTGVTDVGLVQVTHDPIYPDEVVDFRVDVTPPDTEPYSYRITIDGAGGPVLSGVTDQVAFSHTFDSPGSHLVEFAAWNCGRSEAQAITDAMGVYIFEPGVCVGLESVDILGATYGPPGSYTFDAQYQPLGATPPIDYLWDDGGTGASSSRDLVTGTHFISVTASNCDGVMVSDVHMISIGVCEEVTGLGLTLSASPTVYAGIPTDLVADIQPDIATKPYTYALYVDGQTAVYPLTSVDDPLALRYTFPDTGGHALEFWAWNCDMTQPITDRLPVEVLQCVQITGVSLAPSAPGPILVGQPISLSADIQPDEATPPYTYTVHVDGQSIISPSLGSQDPLAFSYTFPEVGSYVLQVGVWNCGVTQPLTDTFEAVVEAGLHAVYLPIVIKND